MNAVLRSRSCFLFLTAMIFLLDISSLSAGGIPADTSPGDRWLCHDEFPNEDSASAAKKEGEIKRIRKGIYRNGRLWLLLSSTVAAYDMETEKVTMDVLSDTVVDMAVGSDSSFYLLTLSNAPRAFHIIRLREAGGWDTIAPYAIAEDETPLGLSLHGNSLAGVVTTHALYVGSPDKLQRHGAKLRQLGFTLQPSFTLLGESEMVWGRNIGEWGGGLVRWSGGESYVVERGNSDDRCCTGMLESQCDPVTALLPDLQHPGCLIVAIGLRHMMEHGRILRVCGDDVEVLYEQNCPDSMALDCPQAIFGLAPAPDGFWAVTGFEVLKFDYNGRLQTIVPQPRFVNKDGLWLTTEIPGLLIVSTDINRAASVGGYTPLVMAIE